MNNPSKVDDHYKYWLDPPPERSERCQYWLNKIADGWYPNTRIGEMDYDSSSQYYGVYIWEYIHEIYPALTVRTRVPKEL